MSRFAERTTVTVEKSKAELERLLVNYGAKRFAHGWDDAGATVVFEHGERRIRFILPLPDKSSLKYTERADGKARTPTVALALWENECRRSWRALVLVIKAKLEAVESGIATFEEEFLAHIVTKDGSTIGEKLIPQLEAAMHKKLPPLLGMGSR